MGQSKNIIRETHNSLESFCKIYPKYRRELEILVEEVTITGDIQVIEFPNDPRGHVQEEDWEMFKKVIIDQKTGRSGDDFSGFIYAQLAGSPWFKDNPWLKIPYEC